MLWAIASAIEGLTGIIFSARLMKPSVADWLWISGSLALALAFADYQISKERFFGRIRIILDLALMGIAMAVLFWLILLRPVLMIGLAGAIQAFWEQSRAALDLMIFLLILRLILLLEPHERKGIFLVLGLGILLQMPADIAGGYQGLAGIVLPSVWIQVGRAAMAVCVIYAAQMTLAKETTPLKKEKALRRPLGQRLEPVLPLGMMYIVLGFSIADWWISQRFDSLALWALMLMGALLILRQGVIAGQSELRRYAELVNASSDLALIFDSLGKIHLANPAFREAVGNQENDGPIPTLDKLLHGDRSSFEAMLEEADSGWAGEVAFLRSHGEHFPAHLSVKALTDDRGKGKLLAATAHDLTAIKAREDQLQEALDQLAQAQEELQAFNRQLEAKVEARTQELKEMVANLAELNRELKSLDRMKSEFVALVSHELRAPLTTILTGLEVVLRGAAHMEENIHTSLKLIKKEAERLSGFVETILDLSALEAGHFSLQFQALALAELIEEVTSRFSVEQGYGRIQLHLPEGLPLLRADRQALHSVLYHLLDNALKYAPEGEVSLHAAETNDQIEILLVDCGPGIPEEERERVFEMFYRLDTSDARRIYGRGLGLHLVRRFLEVMEGGVELRESQAGGTKARIWLPKAELHSE